MTVFYFTATGNSLAVAKAIGGTLYSIPQIIGNSKLYQDDAIGVVFPIYNWGLPRMVQQFLQATSFDAPYTFAVGTYGFTYGKAMENIQSVVSRPFDYTAGIRMADNFIPGFDQRKEAAGFGKRNVAENMNRIVTEIHAGTRSLDRTNLFLRIVHPLIAANEAKNIDINTAKRFRVDEKCNLCGICAKVCPAGNLSVTDRVTPASRCEGCLACVHLCPQNAVHVPREKNEARWKHPDVTLTEIIKANNRNP